MKSIRNRFGFVAIGLVASLIVGGAASAADAPAVEWKVSDGGNGHWYQFSNQKIGWNASSILALNKAGYLATITSANENTFIYNYLNVLNCWNGERGPLLGGFQDHNASNFSEPSGGWTWVTGETWNFENWYSGEPNNSSGLSPREENFLAMDKRSDGCGWNDMNGEYDGSYSGLLIEWSADCNGDGAVDYGQIKSGELADTNNNGVPDVCELVITSVKPVSGASTGGTAVRINGNNFPISPTVTFGSVSATDIVRVSPSLITAVTPEGTPGMTVVTVNSASSESFYYRPSCDGDLDNNGTIDSSDLGLLLINMGDCSSSLTTQQPQEPMIFPIEAAKPVAAKM